MKALAVLRTDRRTGRAALPGRDRGPVRSPGQGDKCARASQAFREYDAKDVNGGPHHIPRANLKPNIYYKAQDFARGAYRAPGCRGASRADRHLKPVAWLAEDAACGC